MKSSSRIMAVFAALSAMTFTAEPASAQQSARSISISRGSMEFDASGTGTADVFALRADRRLSGNWLLGELGLSYASIGEDLQSSDTRLGVAELQLQVQAPLPYVQPYFGAGIGTLSYLTNANGRGSMTEAVSAGAGLRVDIWRSFGVRADGRVRYWDWNGEGFVNGSGEITAGLAFRF
jgi:Outer membrane protein beta-barrel domain